MTTAEQLIARQAARAADRSYDYAPGRERQELRTLAKHLRAEGLRTKAAIGAPTTGDAGFEDIVGVPDTSPFQVDIARRLVPPAIDAARTRFYVNTPVLSNASSEAAWVPEGQANVVTTFSASYARVEPGKVTATAVVPKEVLEASGAISDQTLIALLRTPIVRKVNATFLSADAAVAGESPAGIVNGVAALTAGATYDAATLTSNLDSVLEAADAAGADLSAAVWVMSPKMAGHYAAGLGLQNLGLRGGELLGAPAFTAPEAGANVFLIDPTRIALAMGEVEVMVTEQAVVQMDTAPTQDSATPTATELVSLWQTNSVGYLVKLAISWETLAGAAQILSPAP